MKNDNRLFWIFLSALTLVAIFVAALPLITAHNLAGFEFQHLYESNQNGLSRDKLKDKLNLGYAFKMLDDGKFIRKQVGLRIYRYTTGDRIAEFDYPLPGLDLYCAHELHESGRHPMILTCKNMQDPYTVFFHFQTDAPLYNPANQRL